MNYWNINYYLVTSVRYFYWFKTFLDDKSSILLPNLFLYYWTVLDPLYLWHFLTDCTEPLIPYLFPLSACNPIACFPLAASYPFTQASLYLRMLVAVFFLWHSCLLFISWIWKPSYCFYGRVPREVITTDVRITPSFSLFLISVCCWSFWLTI